jgi:hypothetical protein
MIVGRVGLVVDPGGSPPQYFNGRNNLNASVIEEPNRVIRGTARWRLAFGASSSPMHFLIGRWSNLNASQARGVEQKLLAFQK